VRTLRSALSREDWQQLNSLLAQALQLEGAARTNWLQRLEPAHVHLRTVLSELLAEADAGTIDDGRAPTAVAQLASEALAAMRRERAGDRVGPWRLVESLGAGGMGDVWKAERADGVMERTAALKLPRAEWIDRGLVERMARERTILARLQHPNIAVLYDAGLTVEGRPYLALEYVAGVAIDAFARDRHLDVRQRVRLMVPVVRAVAYAHSRLVIHRDIKPGNVLVTEDGQPKLLDFGISKLMQGDTGAADETALTRLAGRALTVAYAAPEQLLGQPVTAATDIYSLGVMLFELVAGLRPYRTTTAHALEQEVVRGDLRRPSDVATDKVNRTALRGDLDAIILAALKLVPEERYDSASALADDLERYLAGEPVRAQPDSRAYRLRKFIVRNWVPVSAASAAGAALLIGSATALWQADLAREQADAAAALNTFVLSLIRQADPHASRETKASDVAMLASIEERINGEFKGRPQQLLTLRVTLGDAYRNRGHAVAAQRVYQHAADQASVSLPPTNLQLLAAKVRAADYQLIVSKESARQLDAAIELLRAAGPKGAELLVDALLIRHELGEYFGVPDYVLPPRRYDTVNEALLTATQHFGVGSRQHLRVVVPYSRLVWTNEDRKQANQLIADTLTAAQASDSDVANSPEFRDLKVHGLGFACLSGRASEALPALWTMSGKVQAAHGEDSPELEAIFAAMDNCYLALDDLSGNWVRAAALDVASLRERAPSTALMRRAEWLLVAEVDRYAFDAAAAERFFQATEGNAAAILDVDLRERFLRIARIHHVCILTRQGRVEAAEASAALIKAELDAEFARIGRLAPSPFHQAVFWRCLSTAQRRQERTSEAIQTAQRLIDRCSVSKLPGSTRCQARGWLARAEAEVDSGQYTAALQSLAERRKQPRGSGLWPDHPLTAGRALLGLGRVDDAIKSLQLAYGSWLASSDPRGPYAAEAEYWLARAYLAAGDARGRWMIAEAQQTLAKSPLKHHRALAARPAP
jgi:tRNA A-37 threonylcarbamoyl transferase component Bud32